MTNVDNNPYHQKAVANQQPISHISRTGPPAGQPQAPLLFVLMINTPRNMCCYT